VVRRKLRVADVAAVAVCERVVDGSVNFVQALRLQVKVVDSFVGQAVYLSVRQSSFIVAGTHKKNI
jgi:hypothetical protein